MKREAWLIYVVGWLALLVLLGISAGSAYLHLGGIEEYLPVSLALIQAVIIAVVFMKLRTGSSMKWLFAAAGFYWLLILIGLSSTDYVTRFGYSGRAGFDRMPAASDPALGQH
jgi:cytochrome c oxidase subunit 4